MKLQVRRITENRSATLSMLSMDDVDICFILEDGYRETKIPGATRIPAGVYTLGVREDSPMTRRYDKKYSGISHRGMLWLRNVPGFEYIYFHIGNRAGDTAGCLLVGLGASLVSSMRLIDSTGAYIRLYKIVREVLDVEPVTVEVMR